MGDNLLFTAKELAFLRELTMALPALNAAEKARRAAASPPKSKR